MGKHRELTGHYTFAQCSWYGWSRNMRATASVHERHHALLPASPLQEWHDVPQKDPGASMLGLQHSMTLLKCWSRQRARRSSTCQHMQTRQRAASKLQMVHLPHGCQQHQVIGMGWSPQASMGAVG